MQETGPTIYMTLAVYKKQGHIILVYDLAHHESPIAQWLERPTGVWKVMVSTPVGGSENSFSEYFDLKTRLHYSHKCCCVLVLVRRSNDILFDFISRTTVVLTTCCLRDQRRKQKRYDFHKNSL